MNHYATIAADLSAFGVTEQDVQEIHEAMMNGDDTPHGALFRLVNERLNPLMEAGLIGDAYSLDPWAKYDPSKTDEELGLVPVGEE